MRVHFISSLHSNSVCTSFYEIIFLTNYIQNFKFTHTLYFNDMYVRFKFEVCPTMYTRNSGCVYFSFLHYTVLVYVHAFTMLFSSPIAFRTSYSLRHFISMVCKWDSSLKSVRRCILTIQGACTFHFFTTQ